MSKRVIYAVAGCLVGSLIGLAVPGNRYFGSFLAIAGAGFAVWLGERTGRLRPVDELHKPISLFPEGVPGPR